jgi:hypothetical protein
MFLNLKFEVAIGFGSYKLLKLGTRGLVYKFATILVVSFCPTKWNCHLFYLGINTCIYCMVV